MNGLDWILSGIRTFYNCFVANRIVKDKSAERILNLCKFIVDTTFANIQNNSNALSTFYYIAFHPMNIYLQI